MPRPYHVCTHYVYRLREYMLSSMGEKKERKTYTSGGRVREVTYLEPDEAEALKEAAKRERCSKAEVLRRALRQHLETS